MKLKKLQKLIIKELQECGMTEDKEGLCATLMDKVIVTTKVLLLVYLFNPPWFLYRLCC